MIKVIDNSDLYDEYPPGLDTPFNHMVAYLLRTVDDRDEMGFIQQLRHVFRFGELSETDKMRLCFLLSEYGYFDAPKGEPVSMDELLSSIKAMIEGEGNQ